MRGSGLGQRLAAAIVAATTLAACGAGSGHVTIPSPPPVVGETTTSAPGLGVWPVVDDASAAAWAVGRSAHPWLEDPVAVSAHLVTDLLRLPTLTAGPSQSSGVAADVRLLAAGVPLAVVHLVRIGGHPDSPWSVAGVSGRGLLVTSPLTEAAARSPLTVTGTAVTPPVHVWLLTPQGRLLAQALVGPSPGATRSPRGRHASPAATATPDGSGAPFGWEATLSWNVALLPPVLALVTTTSAADGTVTGLTLTTLSRPSS